MADSDRTSATLRAVGVSRSFEGIAALTDVNMELHRHEVVGLIGPNGAGKSTLVNLLTGFDQLDRGSVELAGRDVTQLNPGDRCRLGLTRTFQRGHSFAALSVRENIWVSAVGSGLRRGAADELTDQILEQLDLTEAAEMGAGALPHGIERKVGVARAIACRPQFVLLDEPAAGLNEGEIPDFADFIASIRTDHDVGVLLIDHNVGLIMSVCDRIYVLDQGVIIAEGDPEAIASDRRVAAAYLGSVDA